MDCSPSGFLVFHYLSEFAQPLVHWVSDAIQSSDPLLLPFFLPLIFTNIRVFSNSSALHIRFPKYWSFSFSISPSKWIFRIYFLWDWLVWSLCCPRGSQESSPAPQFESINYLVLSLLYSSTLTSIHDYWKNHNFDYMDLCLQSDAHFSSVTKLSPTLCDPMDLSMPGFPVHHQHLELAQTHVHWVSEANQLSHPLSSTSPPVFNLSQHQGLF